MTRNKWGKVEKEKKDLSLAKGSSWLTVVGLNNLARKFYFAIFIFLIEFMKMVFPGLVYFLAGTNCILDGDMS